MPVPPLIAMFGSVTFGPTGVMVMLTVSVSVENAVVPPLVVVFTLVPAVPLVWSQARKVKADAMVPV